MFSTLYPSNSIKLTAPISLYQPHYNHNTVPIQLTHNNMDKALSTDDDITAQTQQRPTTPNDGHRHHPPDADVGRQAVQVTALEVEKRQAAAAVGHDVVGEPAADDDGDGWPDGATAKTLPETLGWPNHTRQHIDIG